LGLEWIDCLIFSIPWTQGNHHKEAAMILYPFYLPRMFFFFCVFRMNLG